MMKWWIAGMAGAALVLAGVSIWLGSGAGAPAFTILALYIASGILACASAILSGLRALSHGHRNWAATLYIFVFLMGAFAELASVLPEFDGFTRGPLCSRYFTNSEHACIQSAPLTAFTFYFTPIVILVLAALLCTFWPHRAEPQQAQAVAEESSRQ